MRKQAFIVKLDQYGADHFIVGAEQHDRGRQFTHHGNEQDDPAGDNARHRQRYQNFPEYDEPIRSANGCSALQLFVNLGDGIRHRFDAERQEARDVSEQNDPDRVIEVERLTDISPQHCNCDDSTWNGDRN